MTHACQFDPRLDCEACRAEEEAAERSDDPYCGLHGERFDPEVGCPECIR